MIIQHPRLLPQSFRRKSRPENPPHPGVRFIISEDQTMLRGRGQRIERCVFVRRGPVAIYVLPRPLVNETDFHGRETHDRAVALVH
jgi:hypothetical protein